MSLINSDDICNLFLAYYVHHILDYVVYRSVKILYENQKLDSQLNAGLHFTVGAAFYFVMYLVFRKQMKENANLIR